MNPNKEQNHPHCRHTSGLFKGAKLGGDNFTRGVGNWQNRSQIGSSKIKQKP